MLEFDVKIQSGDLYDYMMHHTYSSASGMMGSAVGAVVLLAGLYQRTPLFILAGAILLIYLPWTLFVRSKRQMLANPSFKSPLHYMMDEEGISVSQGEETQKQKWEDMHKAVSTSRSIILYTSKVNACIFPKKDLGGDVITVIQMISTHMPPDKVKIRLT